MSVKMRKGRTPYKRPAKRILIDPVIEIDARFSLVREDDYRHSTVTARRCVWDGTRETCPSSYRCNY